jgi:DNA-binding NarL/FixJ family response regulator
MRIIVADDQPEVRSALRLLLEEKPEVEIVSEVNNAIELVERVKADDPDLILLDWELPGGYPKALIQSVRNLRDQVSIIALSSSPQVRQEALDAGSQEFVGKSDPPEVLLAALGRCWNKQRS